MLTPHIVRVLDLSDADLRPLKLAREGSTGALVESSPTVPPPPVIREPGSGNSVENPTPLAVRPVPSPPVIIKKQQP